MKHLFQRCARRVNRDVQHEQCDGDGEHTVAECLHPALAENPARTPCVTISWHCNAFFAVWVATLQELATSDQAEDSLTDRSWLDKRPAGQAKRKEGCPAESLRPRSCGAKEWGLELADLANGSAAEVKDQPPTHYSARPPRTGGDADHRTSPGWLMCLVGWRARWN